MTTFTNLKIFYYISLMLTLQLFACVWLLRENVWIYVKSNNHVKIKEHAKVKLDT
jgi:hypothetical protein